MTSQYFSLLLISCVACNRIKFVPTFDHDGANLSRVGMFEGRPAALFVTGKTSQHADLLVTGLFDDQ